MSSGNYAAERAASAGQGGMVEEVEAVARESNMPGYGNPPVLPGQRKGFTPEELATVEAVREWRRQGVRLLHAIGGTDPTSGQKGRLDSAELTLALREIQLAEFWAVRHITGGPSD